MLNGILFRQSWVLWGGFLLFSGSVSMLPHSPASALDRQIRRNPDLITPAAGDEKRVALVIGNGEYESAPLRNPVNDAKALSSALRGLGFDVSEKVNLAEKDMKRAIDEFGDKMRNGGVGLFYYAGHGAQVNGRNYMIPIGAKIQGEGDVEYEAVEVGRVLGKMYDARNRMNIVILDACRDNPYSRGFRSNVQGLAFVNAPSGTVIAYATAPGSVAADGSGKNGLYTGELVKQIQSPGLKVEEVFKRVRAAVQDATGGKQVPWEHSSIVGDFYFKPPSGPGADSIQVAGGQSLMERPQPENEAYGKGSIRVETNPPGATVYFAGTAKGKSPAGITALDPGKVKVQVSLHGYKDQEKEVEIRAGKEVLVSFLLDREAPQAPDTWTESVTGMEFVWVPPGCFQMGSRRKEKEMFVTEEPIHKVCLDGFWMGKTEVTQTQWQKLMGNNPSHIKWAGEHPVENVSWDDSKSFTAKLESQNRGQYVFRLPTEAEWEYACRAGSRTARYWGEDAESTCKYENVYDETAKRAIGTLMPGSIKPYNCNDGHKATAPVGQFLPNSFGLYDMLGNVTEWCEDKYNDNAYRKHQRKNPVYNGDGLGRVCRGGDIMSDPRDVRCANRRSNAATYRNYTIGFRVVRTK